MPVGFAILVSFFATDRWGAPGWIYAPTVSVAVIVGLFSMVRFILSSMRALDSLEKEQKENANEREARAEENKKRTEKANNTTEFKE